jgi:hypothetical protein
MTEMMVEKKNDNKNDYRDDSNTYYNQLQTTHNTSNSFPLLKNTYTQPTTHSS